MNYFVPVGLHSPTRRRYMYMDAADKYCADSLLNKYKIHATFPKYDLVSPDNKYRFIFCDVPKSEIPQFEKAMGEMGNHMLLLGYRDYEEACAKWMSFLEENKRK